MSSPDNPVLEMRRRLGPGGSKWTKGRMLDSKGRVCLVGSVVYSRAAVQQGEKWVVNAASRILMKKYDYGRRDSDTRKITRFNDASTTTFADIEWLLDELESAWELEHG